uniref:Uncharacterized protein n=1 Tax=Sphaerodactylus townsendi TaxID=933632 RepID=A0ACB8F8E8_9SAUR
MDTWGNCALNHKGLGSSRCIAHERVPVIPLVICQNSKVAHGSVSTSFSLTLMTNGGGKECDRPHPLLVPGRFLTFTSKLSLTREQTRQNLGRLGRGSRAAFNFSVSSS